MHWASQAQRPACLGIDQTHRGRAQHARGTRLFGLLAYGCGRPLACQTGTGRRTVEFRVAEARRQALAAAAAVLINPEHRRPEPLRAEAFAHAFGPARGVARSGLVGAQRRVLPLQRYVRLGQRPGV